MSLKRLQQSNKYHWVLNYSPIATFFCGLGKSCSRDKELIKKNTERKERLENEKGIKKKRTLAELKMAGRKTPLNAQQQRHQSFGNSRKKSPTSFFFLMRGVSGTGNTLPLFWFCFFSLHPFACYLRMRILHNLDETGLEETVKRGRDKDCEKAGKGWSSKIEMERMGVRGKMGYKRLEKRQRKRAPKRVENRFT